MLVKVLGAVDLVSSVAFLMLIFGIHVPLHFLLFCAGLLLMKGFFVFAGNVLSAFDILASLLLLLSLIFTPFLFLLWLSALFLLAKGVVSMF